MLNFGLLLEYLSKLKGCSQKKLSDDFGFDPSVINRAIRNKRKFTDVDNEKFIDVFLKYIPDMNQAALDKFYEFLYKRTQMEEIKEYYEDACDLDDIEEAYEEFLRNIVEITVNEIAPKNSRKQTNVVKLVQFKNTIEEFNFFGREEEIEEIHNKFEELQTKLVILCGIGGLGKSFISLKYASVYKSSYDVIHRVIYSDSMKNTIMKLKFENMDEKSLDDDNKYDTKMKLLKQMDERTLLIIDNMDDIPEDKDDFLQELQDTKIRILITSRCNSIYAKKYYIHLKPLALNEQKQLFLHYLKEDNDDFDEEEFLEYEGKNLDRLLEVIDGHTLLLELIPKTMNSSDVTIEQVIDILYSGEEADLDCIDIEKDDKYKQERMDQFVAQLFDTNQLDEESQKALMLLTLVPITGMYRKDFCTLSHIDRTIINNLKNKSWVIINGTSTSIQQIHLHPVIASAVIKNTSPTLDKCKDFLVNVIQYLKEKNNLKESQTDSLCDTLGHALNLDYCIDDLSLLYDMSQVLWDKIEYNLSYKACCLGLDIIEDHILTVDKDIQLQFYLQMAKLCQRIADYDNALKYYKKSIVIVENKDNVDFNRLIDLYDSFAMLLRKDSQYEESQRYFSIAKELIDKHNISDDVLISKVYNDNGVLCLNMKNYDLALEYYQKARALREKLGAEHIEDYAFSTHNIGTIYQIQKDYENAMKYHKKALDIRKNIHEKDHPDIAASLTMIGNDCVVGFECSHDKSYLSQAKEYFDEAYNIRVEHLGENHPDTAWSYFSIGNMHELAGDKDQAIKAFQACLNIRRKFLGDDHKYTEMVVRRIEKLKKN